MHPHKISKYVSVYNIKILVIDCTVKGGVQKSTHILNGWLSRQIRKKASFEVTGSLSARFDEIGCEGMRACFGNRLKPLPEMLQPM